MLWLLEFLVFRTLARPLVWVLTRGVVAFVVLMLVVLAMRACLAPF